MEEGEDGNPSPSLPFPLFPFSPFPLFPFLPFPPFSLFKK